jgi:peptidoglycan/xylan/chitin deacetylase (PgdA/CDA1 family)
MAGAALLGLSFSARFTYWRPNIPGVPVLMYHYITDNLESSNLAKLRVRPSAFARQMNYLKKCGYETITFQDYYRHVTEAAVLPLRPVIISFDDGARDCLTQARDRLKTCGFRGVVFVVSGGVGGVNVWDRAKDEPEIPLLDWSELGELAAEGWEIGSHTVSHGDLTGLDNGNLASELLISKKTLEDRLGREILALSYPYGRHDERVRQAARDAGYRLAVTIRHGKNTPGEDLFQLKRIIIKRKDTLLDLSLKLKKGRSTL